MSTSVTADNVIAVAFPEEASAYEALARLKQLDQQGAVDLRDAVVVTRDQDGKLTVKDEFGSESYQDAATGGLIGLLLGVLGGPLGVLIGSATGILIGSLVDEDDDDETESALTDMSKSLRVGTPGLLAELTEQGPEAVDAVMAHLDGTVVRRTADDVKLELAEAEDAQREAKKKARHELREARHKEHKEKADAKVAELKAKLPGHKQAAGTPS